MARPQQMPASSRVSRPRAALLVMSAVVSIIMLLPAVVDAQCQNMAGNNRPCQKGNTCDPCTNACCDRGLGEGFCSPTGDYPSALVGRRRRLQDVNATRTSRNATSCPTCSTCDPCYYIGDCKPPPANPVMIIGALVVVCGIVGWQRLKGKNKLSGIEQAEKDAHEAAMAKAGRGDAEKGEATKNPVNDSGGD